MDRRNVDILLVRMDKIGDLVLTLPLDTHPALAGANVHWFISHGLGFVTTNAVPARPATEFRRRFTPWEFRRMVTWLRAAHPRTIVLLHNPWWVSCAAWWAGVPERIGRKSQWHSFLFLNLPVNQKRSASDRHESDFNFDLVEHAFVRLGVRASENLARAKQNYLRLQVPAGVSALVSRSLTARGYRVVHPGMAGSALNWPSEFFLQLIEKLSVQMPVVITGTKSDSKYLQGLNPLRENPRVRWLVDELGTAELMDLLAHARSVVAPSTGVLHLAASLGTPSLGIYSPRKVEHPRRWGPKGLAVKYLLPADSEAIGPEVMRQISVDVVYSELMELEQGHAQSHSGV